MDQTSVVDAKKALGGRFGGLSTFLRKSLFSVVSVGPIPEHISFIMDGNRRYAKRRSLPVGEGHKAGFFSLMSILRYCYELGVKYVTVYAFSIDNFKRRPDEVQTLMDLLQEKIETLLEKESIVNEYGIRVYFIGNLKLLNESLRVAAENAMKATANNSKAVLLICVAYTSTDEIAHAVEESCNEKINEIPTLINGTEGDKVNGLMESDDVHKSCNGSVKEYTEVNCVEKDVGDEFGSRICNGVIEEKLPNVKLVDVEKHMYMAVAPDPDILIRTSGETRLSNFLLWQTSNCPLYSPAALWPDLGLWHLVWAILNFQRNHFQLEKKKKQM